MTVKFTKALYYTTYSALFIGYSDTVWQWAKAYTREDGTVSNMGGMVTCKDYITDTMFKDTYFYTYDKWTEEQRKECCFLLHIPTTAIKDRLMENINTFLHPYEKEHKLAKTTLEQVERVEDNNNIYLLRGSKMWMKNTTTMSIYLSLIRMCGHVQDMSITRCLQSRYYVEYCNEKSYMDRAINKGVVEYMLKNPRVFMKKAPSKYHPNTNTDNSILMPTHGVGGVFNIAEVVRQAHEYKTPFTSAIDGHYWRKQMYKYAYGKYYKYNKPTIKRPVVQKGW